MESTASRKRKELSVPQKAYLKWLKREMDLEKACLELPFTIALLLAFSAFAILALRQDIVYSVEHAISKDLEKNANFAFSEHMGHKELRDVQTVADFWSWLRLGFLPQVARPVWAYSEGRVGSVFDLDLNQTWRLNDFGNEPLPLPGEYLHFNRVVGGLRFRQRASAASSCRFPGTGDAWQRWYGKPCMPNYQEIFFTPEVDDAEVFADAVRIEWMLPGLDDYDRMHSQVIDMEDGCRQMAAKNRTECLCESCLAEKLPWLREDAQRAEVSMITYNAHYGLLTHTGVNFWFLRGGRIRKRVEMKSLWVNSDQLIAENALYMVFAIVWGVLLLWIFLSEVREIAVILVTDDESWYKALIKEYFSFANSVDWLSIIVANVLLVIFFVLAFQIAGLQASMDELVRGELGTRQAYLGLVVSFYEEYDATYRQVYTYRLFLCLYPLMLVLRLLKSFDAQPRLAIITETLRSASQDMIHFSLVLSAVVTCLCLDAVLIFGRDIEDLANLARAFHFAFRMVFAEDGSYYYKLEQVSRMATYTWFTSFTVLVVIILLNMLLAIIMDNYMMVKKRATMRASLPHQMREMWRRWRMNRNKERVRLEEIWAAFAEDAVWNRKAMCQSNRLITSTFLLDLVPGLPPSQAERTLHNSRKEHLKETEPPFQLSDAHDMLSGLEAATRKIRNGLYFAFDVVHYFDSRPVPGMGDLVTDTHEKAIFKLALNEAVDEEEDLAAFAARAAREEKDSERTVVAFVEDQAARLSSEVAETLAQSLQVLEARQARIEEREESMAVAVRQMHGRLLQLQGDAKMVARRLEKALFIRQQITEASSWRKKVHLAYNMTESSTDAGPFAVPSLPARKEENE